MFLTYFLSDSFAELGRNLEILAEFAGGSTSVCKYRSVGLSLIYRFVALFYIFIAKCSCIYHSGFVILFFLKVNIWLFVVVSLTPFEGEIEKSGVSLCQWSES